MDEKAGRRHKTAMSTTLRKKNKRKRGKEEEEAGDKPEGPEVQAEEATPAGSSKTTDVKPKNPRGRKKKKETVAEEFEEEDEEERVEETTRKRKAGGCINLQEVVEFQRFVNGKWQN